MTDVTVLHTGEGTGGLGGRGVGSYGSSHIEMTRFVIRDSALCGVQLARGDICSAGECMTYPLGGTMDLHDGEIADNPVGIHVFTEGFDMDRLCEGVVFRDNGVNVDTNEVTVPDCEFSF